MTRVNSNGSIRGSVASSRKEESSNRKVRETRDLRTPDVLRFEVSFIHLLRLSMGQSVSCDFVFESKESFEVMT